MVWEGEETDPRYSHQFGAWHPQPAPSTPAPTAHLRRLVADVAHHLADHFPARPRLEHLLELVHLLGQHAALACGDGSGGAGSSNRQRWSEGVGGGGGGELFLHFLQYHPRKQSKEDCHSSSGAPDSLSASFRLKAAWSLSPVQVCTTALLSSERQCEASMLSTLS